LNLPQFDQLPFSRWIERDPAYPALVTASGRWSYGELGDRVSREIQWQRERDVAGRVVVLLDSPLPESWIVKLLAALALNARVVLTDPDWSGETRQSLLTSLRAEPANEGQADCDLWIARGNGLPIPRSGAMEAGLWLFTSGTTSAPQPHFRSITVLRRMIETVRERMPPDLVACRPRGVCAASVYHGFGLLNGLLLVHEIGGTVVICDPTDPADAVQKIHDSSAEMLFAWPRHFKLLADPALWSRSIKNKLQWSISSATPLDIEVARRFAECSGCSVRQQYGTTETGPLCQNSERPAADLPFCVGTPLRGVDVKICNDRDEPLPPGQCGEVAIRCDHAAFPGPTLAADSWWKTGDFGCRDERGRVFIHRRIQPFLDERKEG
jgi:acyl-coenzyme A synthetase/AMP-(fatty) acid ligase